MFFPVFLAMRIRLRQQMPETTERLPEKFDVIRNKTELLYNVIHYFSKI